MSLRIAFFGSDSFSVQALSKLVNLRNINSSLVSQIDVITRSIKPQGRKRILTDIPIGSYTSNLKGIKLHRADSQNEILDLIEQINPNLAIAVSYGKLVPLSFIEYCKYGGLNVHPSFLPKYSGSSPVQYALMNDDTITGVTIQTLHPTKFDKGEIIAQSCEIPIMESDNYDTLLQRLGEVGSDLLIKAIEQELYKPPITPLVPKYQYSLASKISPSISQINWNSHSNRQLKRLSDTFGSLHTYKISNIQKQKQKQKTKVNEPYLKVILDEISPYNGPLINSLSYSGTFKLDETNDKLIIKTTDGAISVNRLKLQYYDFESPSKFIEQLQRRTGTADLKEFIYCK